MWLAQAEGESAQAVLNKAVEDLNRALTVVLGLEDVIARGNPPSALVTKHNDILAGAARLTEKLCDEVTKGGGSFKALLPASLLQSAARVGLGSSMALTRAQTRGCIVTISEKQWRALPRKETQLQTTVDNAQPLAGFGFVFVVVLVVVMVVATAALVTLSPESRARAYELRQTADNAAMIFGALRDGKISADKANELLKQETERHEAAAPDDDGFFDKIKNLLLIGGALVVAAIAGPLVIEAVQKTVAKQRAAA